MPKPSTETPVSFADSLPGYARGWCWLPHSTTTLTLAMPDGPMRRFHVKYCPQQDRQAWNVSDGLLEETAP
jgi:hypothetical protein